MNKIAEKNKLTVKQTNRLIHSKVGHLNSTALKLFYVACASHKSGKWPNVFISTPELRIIFGCEKTNRGFIGHLRKVTKELVTWPIELKNLDGSYEVFTIIRNAKVTAEGFFLKFDDDLRNEISSICGEKNSFTSVDINYLTQLTSAPSMRLYNILYSHKFKKEKVKTKKFAILEELSVLSKSDEILNINVFDPTIRHSHEKDIEFLGNVLGYANTKSYKKFGNLKQRIIDPIIKDINDNTNIKIIEPEYIYTKNSSGRRTKVAYVIFHFIIQSEPGINLQNRQTELDQIDEYFIKKIHQVGLSTIELAKLFYDGRNQFVVARALHQIDLELSHSKDSTNKIAKLINYTSNIEKYCSRQEETFYSVNESFIPAPKLLEPLLASKGLEFSNIKFYLSSYIRESNDELCTFGFFKYVESKLFSSEPIKFSTPTNKKQNRDAVNKSIRNIYDTSW